MNVNEVIRELKRVSFEIEELRAYKEDIERKLVEEVGRGVFFTEEETGKIRLLTISKEGKARHSFGKVQLEITTDYIYKVDKEKYQQYRDVLIMYPALIKEESKVSVMKDKYRALLQFGPKDLIDIANSVISLEPAKAHVKVIEKVNNKATDKTIEFGGF
jgi:hypothetical protein